MIDELDFAKIGEKIRIMRVLRNKTQQELAADVNITVGHLSNIERGLKKPGLEVMYRISRSVSCTIDELLCQDELSFYSRLIDITKDCSNAELNIITSICNAVKVTLREDYRNK